MQPAIATRRSTREVLDLHLRYRERGELERDLAENYAPDVVLLCDHGPKVGHDGMRESAQRLQRQLASGRFEFLRVEVQGEFAFLRWRGESATALVENGADSFVIRDGRIVMQSVFYTVKPKTSA